MLPKDLLITDDHIHIDLAHGLGVKAVRDFKNAGGTHMFMVSLPSWSHGITPTCADDFRKVFDETLRTAEILRETGVVVFTILGVHPAEITKMRAINPNLTLSQTEEIMKGGLSVAAEYVADGRAVALKSGRPHYPVESEEWGASQRILSHALDLAKDCGCALQIHAETGPCADVADMAKRAGLNPLRVVKHFADGDTPLSPSFIAKSEYITQALLDKRYFTMESDYMDDPIRPGSVIGPKSVPRFTRRLIESGAMSIEDAYRVHKETPERVYGVDIEL